MPPCAVATKTASSDPSPLKSPTSTGKSCSSTNCDPNCAEMMVCASLGGGVLEAACAEMTIVRLAITAAICILFMRLLYPQRSGLLVLSVGHGSSSPNAVKTPPSHNEIS